MNVLVVHQNFPGQFPHIVTALLARGDRVAAIGGPTATARPGVDLRRWNNRRGTTAGIFDPATRAEADLIRAEAAAAAALELKRDGFSPDFIIGHPGWGETIHLKLVWPHSRLLLFGEYWYRGTGGDADFDMEFGSLGISGAMRVQAKNATQALAYSVADRIISPTHFQASTFPHALRDRITVAHEGVDLERARPIENPEIELPGGRVLDRQTPFITFVNRTLEPLRGFHIFMRALPILFEAMPDVHAVIIGEDKTSGYGIASPGGRGWKAALLSELGSRLDMARIHFLGRVPHNIMIAAMSGSAAHVYYTYPFVLSWSLIEAMATECLIVASDTAPVRDAICDGKEGVLLPFFEPEVLATTLVDILRRPDVYAPRRTAARHTALARFDRTQGVARWIKEMDASL